MRWECFVLLFRCWTLNCRLRLCRALQHFQLCLFPLEFLEARFWDRDGVLREGEPGVTKQKYQ
jgi:hypothetical protein